MGERTRENQLPFFCAINSRALREIFAFPSSLRKIMRDRQSFHELLDTKIPILLR